MISANIKTDLKQQEIKELVAISCNFLHLQDFNGNVKRASIFQFNFAWYSSNLTFFIKSRSGGGWGRGGAGLLNRQNPLSVRKVICRQSPNIKTFL